MAAYDHLLDGGGTADLNKYPETASVERITLGHYADQIHAGILRLHCLLDTLDGGRPGTPTDKPDTSLMGDLARANARLEECCERLHDIAERVGRVL